MRKIKIILLPMLLGVVALGSCTNNAQKKIIETSSFLNDAKFVNGFYVKGSKYSKQYDPKLNVYFNPNEKESTPWNMSLWNRADKYDLTKNYTFTRINENKYKYANEARSYSVNNSNGELTLQLDTSLEYIADYGKPQLGNSGEWSHFLIDNRFNPYIYLNKYDECRVKFNFTLNYCDFKGLPTVDRSSADGAAQIFLYFRVFGGNPVSRMMWVGMPLYDSRYNVIAPYMSADSGHAGSTDDLIYAVSNSEYMYVNNLVGVSKGYTYSIDYDFKKLIKKAYDYAINLPEGKCSWKGIDFNDVYVYYFNYGFEMPGAFNMSASISNLDFIYNNFEK